MDQVVSWIFLVILVLTTGLVLSKFKSYFIRWMYPIIIGTLGMIMSLVLYSVHTINGNPFLFMISVSLLPLSTILLQYYIGQTGWGERYVELSGFLGGMVFFAVLIFGDNSLSSSELVISPLVFFIGTVQSLTLSYSQLNYIRNSTYDDIACVPNCVIYSGYAHIAISLLISVVNYWIPVPAFLFYLIFLLPMLVIHSLVYLAKEYRYLSNYELNSIVVIREEQVISVVDQEIGTMDKDYFGGFISDIGNFLKEMIASESQPYLIASNDKEVLLDYSNEDTVLMIVSSSSPVLQTQFNLVVSNYRKGEDLKTLIENIIGVPVSSLQL